MNYKWLPVILCMMQISINAHAQADRLKDDIEGVLQVMAPDTRVDINRADNYIEIDGGYGNDLRVPYKVVNCVYVQQGNGAVDAKNWDYVRINCPDSTHCFTRSGVIDTRYVELTLPFKNSAEAHKFIGLMNQLKGQGNK